MRIGILTFHRAYNCGAALQAWALRMVLERMGNIVEFPACNFVGVSKRWLYWPYSSTEEDKGIVRRIFRWLRKNIKFVPYNLFSIPCQDILRYRYHRFRKAFLPECKCTPAQFADFYDVMLIGSDQVWNEDITKRESALFRGEWTGRRPPRIAYAASCGDRIPSGAASVRLRKALSCFAKVSVRERRMREWLSRYCNKPVAETVDPTLLLNAADYDVIAAGAVPSEPYLFLYVLTAEPFYVKTARELASRLGVKCVMAACYQYTRWRSLREMVFSLSPDRLVQFARHAKYVVSSSFHGTVMGILFKKPFLSLRDSDEESESRIGALLRKIECENRLACPRDTIEDMIQVLCSELPDYSARLEAERTNSLLWLQGAIQQAYGEKKDVKR